MKKVLFIMLIVVLLVALAAPAFADKKVTPNCWGQLHKNNAPVNESVHGFQDVAKGANTNFGQYCKDTLKPDLCGE